MEPNMWAWDSTYYITPQPIDLYALWMYYGEGGYIDPKDYKPKALI